MTFGSTPDSLFYEILFGLGALAAVGVAILLGRLIQAVFRIKLGLFTPIFVLVVILGSVLGLSLYLDTTGQVAVATISKKEETIHFREEGDWTHDYAVWASYQAVDGSNPGAFFNTTETVFDALHQDGRVQVRAVSINGWFDLVRFADQSTWSWLPWSWLALGLGILLLGFLGWKSLDSGLGCLGMIVLLLLLAATPFAFKYHEWRNSEDASLTPLRATGVVQEVRRVTTIDPLPSQGGDNSWNTKIDVAQGYDIVVVAYTPRGYEEPVLGVDAVDAQDFRFVPDAAVEIAYAAGDPRTIRLPNATRFHHIRNPQEWLKQQVIGVIVLVLAMFGFAWASSSLRRLIRARGGAGSL